MMSAICQAAGEYIAAGETPEAEAVYYARLIMIGHEHEAHRINVEIDRHYTQLAAGHPSPTSILNRILAITK